MNQVDKIDEDMARINKEVKTKKDNVTFFPEYRIYKPNKAGNGSATRLQIRHGVKQERAVVFLFIESAQQTGTDKDGNASFAWKEPDKKITFKLDTVDIGDLLAVLNGAKTFAGNPAKDGKGGMGIYHQNDAGNTVLKFEKAEQGNVYWYGLSSKRNGKLIAIKHMITLGEAEILRVLLQEAVKMMFNWR